MGTGLVLIAIGAILRYAVKDEWDVVDLTTVGQPCRRMGARVVELVVERLRGRRVVRHEVLPTVLVPRARPRPVSALPSASSGG